MPTAPCFYVKVDDKISAQIDLAQFPFTIGRSRECDFVIDSTEISRVHIQLNFDHQQVVLRDMGSTNGTFLNDVRLQPHKDYRLRANDAINLANACLLFFDDPATTAQVDPGRLRAEGLRLDEATAQVFIANRRMEPPLSPSQILLLQLLVRNEGAVVTRDHIRANVWHGKNISDQAIDALVSRLRKRIEEMDPQHDYIVTRRGFGLIFRNRHVDWANST
jgi:pSer/pThr/pTyr-binding forkhead associated (FHA) protein